MMYKNDQLCFSCKNACGGCSWSSKLIPVDDWIAEPSVLKDGTETYKIIKCDQYVYDGLCLRCKYMPKNYTGDIKYIHRFCSRFSNRMTQGYGDCVMYKNIHDLE